MLGRNDRGGGIKGVRRHHIAYGIPVVLDRRNNLTTYMSEIEAKIFTMIVKIGKVKVTPTNKQKGRVLEAPPYLKTASAENKIKYVINEPLFLNAELIIGRTVF
ncbi:hypothetical protein KDK_69750 [Dictyobacter kobayashii]|uniref:Uncharacterized protein n=1 Tax=Dictyobacter kobayashii TaxID=2014872 RepID=A0A402AVT5_9CHLR|nr:hypothetical protein KDK_69750 [Dictyobacter kobayashii]